MLAQDFPYNNATNITLLHYIIVTK